LRLEIETLGPEGDLTGFLLEDLDFAAFEVVCAAFVATTSLAGLAGSGVFDGFFVEAAFVAGFFAGLAAVFVVLEECFVETVVFLETGSGFLEEAIERDLVLLAAGVLFLLLTAGFLAAVFEVEGLSFLTDLSGLDFWDAAGLAAATGLVDFAATLGFGAVFLAGVALPSDFVVLDLGIN